MFKKRRAVRAAGNANTDLMEFLDILREAEKLTPDTSRSDTQIGLMVSTTELMAAQLELFVKYNDKNGVVLLKQDMVASECGSLAGRSSSLAEEFRNYHLLCKVLGLYPMADIEWAEKLDDGGDVHSELQIVDDYLSSIP